MRARPAASNRLPRTILLLSALLFATLSAWGRPETVADLTGFWGGPLQTSAGIVTVIFHFQMDGDHLRGTLDSPDQGVMGIVVQQVTFEQGTLFAEIAPGIEYRGTLRDNATFDGNFSQGGMSMPLVLQRQKESKKIDRPQEPKEPFPYKVSPVTFDNKKDSVTLAGTLTLPEGAGPFPAAILISGSGPQNRDSALAGHRPFWVLADHLSRRGIAVLRYDDRGVDESTGDFSTATLKHFAADADAAVKFLHQHPGVASITLVGHSEGGFIAPMVSVGNELVDALVLLAGPGTPGRQVILDQEELLAKAAGVPEPARRNVRRRRGELFDQIAAGDESVIRQACKEFVLAAAGSQTADEGLQTQIDALIEQSLNPWYQDFVAHDPYPILVKVRQPVLALNGEKDLQVPPADNLAGIARALKAGGNHQVEVMELPNLNHLFQTAETGHIAEYGQIRETFAPAALDKISAWILARQDQALETLP